MNIKTSEDLLFWICKYFVEFFIYGRDNVMFNLNLGAYI